MIETFDVTLPNGTTLACRASGELDAPTLLFLHGFPEGAFIWDDMLEHFGARFRCVAPYLRGYGGSSAPAEVSAYRGRELIGDITQLIDQLGGRVAALVAHDWGGALAWAVAAQHPARLERLVIVNAPHPATFLRGLQSDPAQQAASAYMNYLRRDDAHERLAADDFARMWPFFEQLGATDAGGAKWLTDELRERYRALWRISLCGGCNYYRASPLHPPVGPDDPVLTLALPPEATTVRVPTRVVWGEDDRALPIGLLDGLEEHVPELTVVRVPGATHWIVHEQPARIAAEIEAALAA
ncbi:alpha/beta fold hydrolase [Piscinibacter koreensis]|uniref:Alpha/beta hydrolase n=1 Tax=Piscinibacter koreensis TaxID=2742824 RepID=A0A7Y6NM83_9BURK|nr:alpha/beta hydrolase [Schlegelella koreensis]NUZ05662.1 alpha/beta hydrolase [Schlegelella koreensis]